jgi:hypothetical protein
LADHGRRSVKVQGPDRGGRRRRWRRRRRRRVGRRGRIGCGRRGIRWLRRRGWLGGRLGVPDPGVRGRRGRRLLGRVGGYRRGRAGSRLWRRSGSRLWRRGGSRLWRRGGVSCCRAPGCRPHDEKTKAPCEQDPARATDTGPRLVHALSLRCRRHPVGRPDGPRGLAHDGPDRTVLRGTTGCQKLGGVRQNSTVTGSEP